MNAPEKMFTVAGPGPMLPGGGLTPEEKRRQRVRSLAIAWALGALALIFFLATIVHMAKQ